MFRRISIRRAGFTLIELLIVITIIGMLASIILVSLNSAKEKSLIGAGQQLSGSLYQAYGADARGIWTLNEGSGSVTKNDATSQNETIDMTGVSWTSGINGRALRFTGAGGGVTFPTGIGPLATFTYAAWVYNETSGDSRHSIIEPFWEIVNNDQICLWSYAFSVTYWRCSPAGSVASNKWVFLATSWDGSVIRHYVNGKLVWTDTATATGSGEVMTSIGKGCCGGRQFYGNIDDVRIYTGALGRAAIEKAYAEGLPKYRYALRNQPID